MTQEALKLALEALELTNRSDMRQVNEAITAIKEALAQPEQEPVAWRYRGNLHEFDPSDWAEGPVTPLYTTPPQRPWVDLTDEDWEHIHDMQGTSLDNFSQGAAWAEAKLKERNA